MNPLVRHSQRLWLYLVAGLVLIFLAAPIFVVVPMSFSGSRFLDFPPETWSLRWYERLLTSVDWYGAMLVSLALASMTALVATPLGVAAAYAVHVGEHPICRRLQVIFLLPLMVPHIILGIGIFYIYARANWLGSFPGLVLAHVMLALPFVVITTMSGLRSFDMTQELAARSFGCSRLRAFLSVTLPQIKGSIFSSVLFAFVTSLDEVVVSLFISAGENTTITKVMFSSLRDEIDPTIAAASSLLIGGSLLLAILAMVSARLGVAGRRRVR